MSGRSVTSLFVRALAFHIYVFGLILDHDTCISSDDFPLLHIQNLSILKHFRNTPLTKMIVSSLIVIIFTWR